MLTTHINMCNNSYCLEKVFFRFILIRFPLKHFKHPYKGPKTIKNMGFQMPELCEEAMYFHV